MLQNQQQLPSSLIVEQPVGQIPTTNCARGSCTNGLAYFYPHLLSTNTRLRVTLPSSGHRRGEVFSDFQKRQEPPLVALLRATCGRYSMIGREQGH